MSLNTLKFIFFLLSASCCIPLSIAVNEKFILVWLTICSHSREDRNESRKRGFDDGPAPRFAFNPNLTSMMRGGGGWINALLFFLIYETPVKLLILAIFYHPKKTKTICSCHMLILITYLIVFTDKKRIPPFYVSRERTSFGRGGGSSGPPRGGFNSMRGGKIIDQGLAGSSATRIYGSGKPGC